MTDRASLLSDHRMPGLPICAKYKHFKTISEHTFDNSPQISILLLWNDDHPSKGSKLCTVALPFYLPIRNIFQRMFEHVLPYRATTPQFSRDVLLTMVIFQLLQQKYVILISLYTVQ